MQDEMQSQKVWGEEEEEGEVLGVWGLGGADGADADGSLF
jgi:hypothetical protein